MDHLSSVAEREGALLVGLRGRGHLHVPAMQPRRQYRSRLFAPSLYLNDQTDCLIELSALSAGAHTLGKDGAWAGAGPSALLQVGANPPFCTLTPI